MSVPVNSKARRFLSLGTRSVLFGAHQFLLHPFFLAVAWSQLYGFPVDPRIWAAFFLHDLGYIGKDNLDGAEGETHPELGGKIMARLFGQRWGDFTMNHSRFFASLNGGTPSALCAADKLATTIVPKPLYLFLIHLSGEVDEYLEHFREALNSSSGKYALEARNVPSTAYKYGSVEHWYASAMLGNQRWIAEHTQGICSEQSM
jgi:hypothetical protein